MIIPAGIELITHEGEVLAYIVKKTVSVEQTQFFTPDSASLQIGMIVYGKDTAIQPHLHLDVTREVQGTSEVIFVRQGACTVDFYNQQKTLLTSRDLHQGDIVLLIGGGHGFRMNEDTILFEVKQGPYLGLKDKERFNP